MASPTDQDSPRQGATGGDHLGPHSAADKLARKASSKGRDDTLEEDLERERLEPGLDAEGTGGAGANPSAPHDGGNSNT